MLLIVVIGTAFSKFGPDLVLLVTCEGSVLFGRLAQGENCVPAGVEEHVMIGTLLAGVSGLIGAAYSLRHGMVTRRQAIIALVGVFVASFFLIVDAARGEDLQVDREHLPTPFVVYVGFITLLLVALNISDASAHSGFDLIFTFGVACILGFVFGLIVQAMGPALLDGLSNIERWPELIVAPSAATAGGAAFVSVITGFSTIQSARRGLKILAVLLLATSLALSWAFIDYLPDRRWISATGTPKWQVVAVIGAVLLPAIAAASVANILKTGASATKLYLFLSVSVVPFNAAAGWIGAGLYGATAERQLAVAMSHGATPLVVFTSVWLADVVYRVILSDAGRAHSD